MGEDFFEIFIRPKIKSHMLDASRITQCQKDLLQSGYRVLRQIGQGAFGVVFMVENIGGSNQVFSAKCTFKKKIIKSHHYTKFLQSERNIMKKLSHHNIVEFIESFESNDWIFMILEYCNEGNLSMLQMSKQNRKFTYKQFKNIFVQILSGLQYLHQKKILHRDIKPQNILMHKQNQPDSVVKICDFGLSKQIVQGTATVCGTMCYMAPQIYEKKQYYQAIDVWSIGVVAHSMLFGFLPFKSLNMYSEIVNKCQNGFILAQQKVKLPSDMSEHDINFLSKFFLNVFELNPTKRWTISQILCALDGKKHEMKVSLITNASLTNSPIFIRTFQLQLTNFVLEILHEIQQTNFLTEIQMLILSYQLNKVCISILSCGRDESELTSRERILLSSLKNTHSKNTQSVARYLQMCEVQKFKKLFNASCSLIFSQYKEQYRAIVGHTFYKAQKNIQQKQVKIRMKLKILCLHTINRVFQKQYSSSLFCHFVQWLKQYKKQAAFSSNIFQFRYFKMWIEQQDDCKILETINKISKKIYGTQK